MMKDIKGFEGVYQVNESGQIYSVRKKIILKNLVRGQYLFVQLRDRLRELVDQESVHRIVATAFIPNPENKPCVNHKDGNKFNNNVENLEWVTRSENTKHAYATGLMFLRQGETPNVSKLTEKEVLEIRALSSSIRKTAVIYNVSPSAISLIRRRERWNHI